MTTLPALSTPCTWNTFLARSTPMVLTCIWTTPSGDSLFNDPLLAHSMPGAGVVHHIIFDRLSWSCLPVHVRVAPKADLRLAQLAISIDATGADDGECKPATAEGRYSLRSCRCDEKIGLTVVPLDLRARPIGSDDRALIGRAVMP